MAGYVKLYRSVWQDPDFVALPPAAQRLYFLLISQPDLTHVGVLPLMPARWSRLSAGTTPAEVRDSIDTLAAADFVRVDADTEELWVRSYIDYDEAWRLTNGAKSLVRAYGQVLSRPLAEAIATVLARVGVRVATTLDETVAPFHHHHPSPTPPPSSSSTSSAGVASNPQSDDGAPSDDDKGKRNKNAEKWAAECIDAIIGLRAKGRRPDNPTAYLKASRAQFATKERATFDALIDANPHWRNSSPEFVAQCYQSRDKRTA